MSDCLHWRRILIVAALILPVLTGTMRADGRPLYLPLVMKAPTGQLVQVSGHVFLEGRDNHSGASLWVDGRPVALTASDGSFAFSYRLQTASTDTFTVTAKCQSYLWAETVLTTQRSTVFALPDVCLLGGDVAGGDSTTVAPAEGCPSTDPVQVPGPADGQINIFDLTLINKQQGVSSADPGWGPDPCNPGVPYLGYRADVNGDGMVDPRDYAIAVNNVGKTAPLPWVPCSQ